MNIGPTTWEDKTADGTRELEMTCVDCEKLTHTHQEQWIWSEVAARYFVQVNHLEKTLMVV